MVEGIKKENVMEAEILEVNKTNVIARKDTELTQGYYEIGFRKDGGTWNVLKTNEGNDFNGTVPSGKKWVVAISVEGREEDL